MARDDIGWDQGGSSGGGEKWSGSGPVLKWEPVAFLTIYVKEVWNEKEVHDLPPE